MKKAAVLSILVVAVQLAVGVRAEAEQAKKVPRVVFIGAIGAHDQNLAAFRQGLRELGYVEGQNIVVETRSFEGQSDRLTELAAELVREKFDVLVTPTTVVAQAVRKLSTMIAIVIVATGDPIGTGLVASLAHPGGNVTGLSGLGPELSGKRLELLKEAFPKISHVAVFWNTNSPSNAISWKETQAAALPLAVQLQSLEVRSADDFERAFRAAASKHAEALITIRDVLTNTHRKEIVAFAAKSRLPAMYPTAEFAEEGGLMSYAPDFRDLFWRAAVYVDKILNGTKPADLPVEQPMKFEFVINLKTAKQIGLTIPPNVLVRADRVIK
jgi:putative ABC transport system substrate-binding protein